jgi:cyclic pyranopterin phosphate synthase
MTGSGPEDRHGRRLRDLRISVTDRCNFRCPYCMPAEVFGRRYEFLPKTEILTYEEIARVTRSAASLGVRKVRLTGGEPLLRADLCRLVTALAAVEGVEDLSLTTNGHLLASFAGALAEAGLRRVTVSLDSLDEQVFKSMSGRRFTTVSVLAGIEAAERAGLSPVKINCVVKRGVNDGTLLELAERFRGTGHVVRFIEYMDVGNLNGWDEDQVVSAAEILEIIGSRHALEPVPPAYPGEVATRYRYADGAGEIGVIASVTRPFCSACTRARLTPEGRLVTCLFASGGTDLRGPLRAGATDAELRELLHGIWARRADRYSEERAERKQHGGRKIEMHRLGG